MHIERIYQSGGLIYVSVKARIGSDILLERFFALSKETEGKAKYLCDWLFREFLFRGMKQLSALPPRYIMRKLAACGENVKIISHGTAERLLNRRRKIKWFWEWLKYKLAEIFFERDYAESGSSG